ncbi:MAG: glutaredoxin domain-containing protein [Synechococcaceae cyanobacterium]|nr:glutaredoxin domain-containing protein [Synechococcaceae cyanobacterium]
MGYSGLGSTQINAFMGRFSAGSSSPQATAAAMPTSGDANNDAPPIKVEIYSRRFCADSMRAKGLLDRKRVQYNEYLIDNDHLNNSAMVQRSNGRTATPQIFVAARHLGGFSELMELESAGELDGMLGIRARGGAA